MLVSNTEAHSFPCLFRPCVRAWPSGFEMTVFHLHILDALDSKQGKGRVECAPSTKIEKRMKMAVLVSQVTHFMSSIKCVLSTLNIFKEC
jgi:hypothetical protein